MSGASSITRLRLPVLPVPIRPVSYLISSALPLKRWVFATVLRTMRPLLNATMCLMAGMAPAFIAKQLGHSIQILLTRHARWIDGEGDWAEMNTLRIAPKLPQD